MAEQRGEKTIDPSVALGVEKIGLAIEVTKWAGRIGLVLAFAVLIATLSSPLQTLAGKTTTLAVSAGFTARWSVELGVIVTFGGFGGFKIIWQRRELQRLRSQLQRRDREVRRLRDELRKKNDEH